MILPSYFTQSDYFEVLREYQFCWVLWLKHLLKIPLIDYSKPQLLPNLLKIDSLNLHYALSRPSISVSGLILKIPNPLQATRTKIVKTPTQSAMINNPNNWTPRNVMPYP